MTSTQRDLLIVSDIQVEVVAAFEQFASGPSTTAA